MRITTVFILLAILVSPALVSAQGGSTTTSAEPFKLGTFEINGSPHVGIVLRDSLIVDLNPANAALETDLAYPNIPMPADMLGLIGRYEYGLKLRLYEIVNDLVGGGRLAGDARPEFVYELDEVRTLAPILYPGKILNAAVNFFTHVNETGTPEERAEARRQRVVNRGVPYLFLKPSRGAVIGTGEFALLNKVSAPLVAAIIVQSVRSPVSKSQLRVVIWGGSSSTIVIDAIGEPPGT